MKKSLVRVLALATMVAAVAVIVACSGSTDGGSEGDKSFDGTSYNGAESGSMTLTLQDTSLSVSGTTDFEVVVRDASGNPVPDIQVSCDTEAGLALLEPADGIQTTSGGGGMSGVVGCAEIGSFRMGCRLPVGAGKRKYASVKCAGPIPTGFDGFPGAGGGGLGGGSSIGDISDNVRVTAVGIFDFGQSIPSSGDLGDLQVDTDVIANCAALTSSTPPATITREGFFDTIATVDVENFYPEAINFTSVQFTVANSDNSQTSWDTLEHPLLNADEVAGSDSGSADQGGSGVTPGTKRFMFYFAKAGSGTGGDKGLVDNPESLPTTATWLSNVRITLTGVSTSGKEVTVTKTVTISFGPYNRC